MTYWAGFFIGGIGSIALSLGLGLNSLAAAGAAIIISATVGILFQIAEKS